MKRGSEIEGWKLTPETKRLMKSMRRVNQKGRLLRKGIQLKMAELQQMQQALQGVEGLRRQLMTLAPENKTFGIPGQVEGAEAKLKFEGEKEGGSRERI